MLQLTNIPHLINSIFCIEKENKYILLNQELPDWVVLNQNSAYIVGLIDGQKSIDEIIKIMIDKNSNIDENSIFKLFENLYKHNIIKNANDFEIKFNKKPSSYCGDTNSSKKLFLHSVHIKMTDECNLACKYCYSESGANCKDTLTLDTLKDIAYQVKEITSHVGYTISGGEPLLNPDTLEYVKFLKELGNDICLLTNGLLINENNAKFLAENCSMIKISLDGSNDNINGLTRGKNGFDKIMNSYELLLKHNANVMINMTVTKKNVNDIQNMVETFGSRLSLQPFFKAGRGSGNEDLEITGSEYFHAMANVDGVNPLGAVARTLDTLRGRGVTKCAMADSEISISENGDVFPCQMLTDDEFCGGNIKTQPIKEILNSEVFKNVSSFSSTSNEDCKICPIRLLCGGACRARSYFETGSIFVNSDFCEYEKLAYINAILEYTELEEI